jgi:hypothetical protein
MKYKIWLVDYDTCIALGFWHATKEIGSWSRVVHEYEGFQMNLATSDGKGMTATNRGATNDDLP